MPKAIAVFKASVSRSSVEVCCNDVGTAFTEAALGWALERGSGIGKVGSNCKE